MFEPLFLSLVIALVVPILLRPAKFGHREIALITIILFVICFVTCLTLSANKHDKAQASSPSDSPLETPTDGFVGSDTCRTCHPNNHATWHASYHRKMTQVPTRENVLSDFDNTELRFRDVDVNLYRKGDEFWADLPDPMSGLRVTAQRMQRQIKLMTGSHHTQVYWYSTGRGRELAMLPFVYLVQDKQWAPNKSIFVCPQSIERIPADGRWNSNCVFCHTTYGQMRRTYYGFDSRAVEFGIGCESCHGPGEQHVKVNSWPVRRYQQHVSRQPDDTIQNPAHMTAERSSQVCGCCHGVTTSYKKPSGESVGENSFKAGNDLLKERYITRYSKDHKNAPQLAELLAHDPEYIHNRFWSDGMIRVSGREYNGLIETPCHQYGEMSCLSCHQMHKSESDTRPIDEWANDQLKPGMRTNKACVQCHEEYKDEETLIDHTHHPADSHGSNCYNCHMSYTTYGLLKAIRSHQIDSPRVQASLETGRPNACNQCHLDKTLAWTAGYLEDWYGIKKSEFKDKDHETVAASVHWLLKGEAGQRALMAWSYSWQPACEVSGTEWMAPYLGQLLEDPYDAVRFIAYRSLRQNPDFENFEYDFLGLPDALADGNRRVLSRWNQLQKGKETQNRIHVLLDDSGDLMREKFKSLLQDRNDRIMDLAE